MNSVKTVSGVYSVALHCSAQAQPRPVITWTRRRPGWVTIYWTYFVFLSWNVDVWHSDYTQWIVTNLFIYWLPHCTVTAIKGKLGEKFTFELTPYTAISTLLILKFLWFYSSDFKNLVFVNSLVLYFNTKTKFSLFRENLMKYPSSLKVSAPWWCDISPDFREELAEVLPSDKYRISNSEPEPFELGADIYTTNSVLRRPELYCHTVMTR